MISIDYNLVVPDFRKDEISFGTLVQSYVGKFQFDVTNDGREPLSKLSARAVLESYIGQEKPQLFQWADTQVIKSIPPKEMVSIEFEFFPWFPGLVSVALYVTDAANKAVKAKRETASVYGETPVRNWFYVFDEISLKTLRALRELLAREKETKK